MKRQKSPALLRGKSAATPESAPWPLVLVFALLLIVTLIAYFPALTGGFLWDDAGHVTAPALQSWSGLSRIWFEVGATQQYYPLLHSAFWVEHKLWGDATIGYHLINELWHVTSAGLLVAILRRLTIPGAVLAALIFAIHPVGVESVAWISEQKNTLSTVFYLAATLAWIRYEDDRSGSRYAVAFLWFVAALLTKTVTATLPATLLVIAWWRRGRLSWRGDVLPLLPWFIFGAVAGLGTTWFEHTQIGATGSDFTLTVIERVLLAGRVIWFYLGSLLWPTDLIFFYPRWIIDASSAALWISLTAIVVTLAAGVWWTRRDRGPLAAALLFGGTLFPVLGFVNVYPFIFSYVADHFQYLANLGIFTLLAATAVCGFARLDWPRWTGVAIAAGVLSLLGALTWRQCGMYRDVFSLYETTLARNPDSWVAHLNLGTALDDTGRSQESLPHLQRALELKPNYPETLNSLGNVLNRLGRAGEAQPLLEKAIQLQPRSASTHNTLGVTLMTLGQSDAGMTAFQRALKISPELTLARVNLGWALANAGREADALEQFELARHQQPDNADVEFKWGLTLAMNNHLADALAHFIRTVALDPNHAQAEFQAGATLVKLSRNAEAVPHFENALALDENNALAHLQLALALRTMGRTVESNEHYQEAIRLNPALTR